jgi:hypothetical protein
LRLVLPLVPYRDWLARLKASAERPDAAGLEKNPVAKMLDFFGSLTTEGDAVREVLGFPALSTVKAVRASPKMTQLRERPVEQRNIDSWLTYWKLK